MVQSGGRGFCHHPNAAAGAGTRPHSKLPRAWLVPAPRGDADPILRCTLWGREFPNPLASRRLRQGRAGARCDACAGLRLRRGRHGDAAAAARQSEAAACSACRTTARSSIASASTTPGLAAAAERLAVASRPRRRGRRQYRQESRHRATLIPITRRACASWRRSRRLSRRQHLLAEHPRPARAAAPPPYLDSDREATGGGGAR